MSILNGIKRSVVGKLLYDIRDIYRFPQGMSLIRRIRNCSKNYCILLGTPTFNNIGDHLIALAELKFLEENLKEYQVIEIPTQAFFRYKEVLKDIISTDVPVFITGGGWMGSLWKDDELRMQEMIKTFQDNTITVFPQTVYYENSK